MVIEDFSIVVFRVNKIQCAADVEPVVTVMKVKGITPTETTAPWMAGVVPFEQGWVPVVDLEARWGHRPDSPVNLSTVIITRVQGRRVGFQITECVRVMPLALEQISSLPPLVARAENEPGVWAVARIEEDVVPLIEWESILTQEERRLLSAWEQGQSGHKD